MLALLQPDVEWVETAALGIPTLGTHHGPAEVVAGVFANVPETFDRFVISPEELMEAGDRVVVTGRIRATTKAGKELNAPFAHLFVVKDSKIASLRNFHDRALWLEAINP